MMARFKTGLTLRAIYLAVGLFAASAAGAFWLPQATVQEVLASLAQMVSPLQGASPILLFGIIFLNNALKAFLVILSGWLLGVGPVAFLVINGLVLGLAIRAASAELGVGGTVLALLPHGVVEFPAILLASALGLHIAGQLYRNLLRRPSRLRVEFRQSLLLCAYFIVPALLLAALMEAFVTSRLVLR